MKRLFVLFAFLMLSCAFYAQDAKAQSEGTLLIVPRVEAEPLYSFSDRQWQFDMGNTSLYTVFDGNLGDYFSFSFSNHWFAFTDSFNNTKDLYTNTWRADVNNWVDWANVSLHLGNFSLTLGKDYIHFGTFESDAYDFDSHWQLNSMLWNNYQVYQWGGSLNWTSSDESTTVMLQMTSDQTMEKPFGSKNLGDYAYNLFASHESEEGVTIMGSFGHYSLGWMGAIGLQISLSDALTLTGDTYISNDYFGASAKLGAELGDKVDLFVKGGFDICDTDWISRRKVVFGGVGAYWYPLRGSKDLRIHALCAYDKYFNSLDFSAGITYALNLKLF